MAHFAQLDENNVVTQVIVVSNDDTSDSNGTETESIGCLLYTSPSPRDAHESRMPSSA